MPVALSYPGVYIEEIPSGVRTLTGVSTSITAFSGYTERGAVDEPVHIFSFADFERNFGGLSSDSTLSYCVKHFFQNGGTEAYVVRSANGALPASVTLKSAGSSVEKVLTVSASTPGTWGNNLQIDVDYNTLNPDSLFNLGVTEYMIQDGKQVVGRSEIFRNLTLNSKSPSYVENIVNARSQLITIKLPAPLVFNTPASSISGELQPGDVNGSGTSVLLNKSYRVAYMLNGRGPFEVTVLLPTAPPPGTPTTLADYIKTIGADIKKAIDQQSQTKVIADVEDANKLKFTVVASGSSDIEQSSIQFLDASTDSATAQLKLGLMHGGIEADGAASFRPVQTGTVSVNDAKLPLSGGGTAAYGALKFLIFSGGSTTQMAKHEISLWGGTTSPPVSLNELVGQINTALAAIQTDMTISVPVKNYLAGAVAELVGRKIRILPSPLDPNISFEFNITGTPTDVDIVTAQALGFNAQSRNVARYALGVGKTAQSQQEGKLGTNGTAPTALDLIGSEAAKTGIYALEDVDLFNLLVIPEASLGEGMINVLSEAIAYCTRRRALMIIDVPENKRAFAEAERWASGQDSAPLRSRNAAIYFPWIRESDPLMGGVVMSRPSAGAIAGIYARTDAERGVWKAPAGTNAMAAGATGLSYKLTDKENGTLNQLGINCLRTFPVIGHVSWGARTGRGADRLADEYKYVPVRRLALFLEESLYRGTQWVVFEPNDEPLWAQIRLNLGAFMHSLFTQGAFQGRTPRQAYFVHCDKETTTQNDIDLGRVNIVVGFAPLKPAEFVVIQIQQIAGAIQT
jgi:phage tail sheath protein FI